jgi:hypothetical protein
VPAGGVATTSRVFFTGSTTTFSVPVNPCDATEAAISQPAASAVPPATDSRWREHPDRAIVVGGRARACSARTTTTS